MIDGNLAMASERVYQGPHDHEPDSQSELIVALSPCPFCGSKAVFKEDSDIYMIGCSDVCCGVCPDTGWRTDKDQTIAAWNSRKGA